VLADLGVGYGPSQYATLDMVCYYGCLKTGASNCADICLVQTPTQVPTQTADQTSTDIWLHAPAQTPAGSSSVGQYLGGLDVKWVVAGLAALLGVAVLTR